MTRRDEHRRPEEAAGAARPSVADDRSEAVADEQWDRVRRLAERVARYEEADALGELDEDGRARLDALRLRAVRAAERAQLADRLADLVAEAREAGRRRTQFP